MFLPPLSVFTQCIQCAPGIPHANFVEQFVTFAERHLDKSRLEKECWLDLRQLSLDMSWDWLRWLIFITPVSLPFWCSTSSDRKNGGAI